MIFDRKQVQKDLLCDKSFPGETQPRIFSSQIETIPEQSAHTAKVQLGGQVRLIGVIYMPRGKGLLTGAGMGQKTAVSPKPNLALKAGNREHTG